MRAGRAAAVAAAALLALLIASTAAQAQTPPPYPWDKRVESASVYARLRNGRVAFAVVDPSGRVRGRDIHERHRSASVVKAMLLVAYLDRVGGRPLDRRDKALLRPMITRSDNGAATRVRNIVGNAGLVRLARRVRMKDFATARSWGSTQISPYDQTRLFWGIDSYLPARHRGYARALLANVIPSQRWGLPPALPTGWRIYFKGGWVPPRLVNQVGVLERGDAHIAIAVFTDGDPSFRYGQQTITGVGRRLLARVNAFAP
jgi:beta-lactamase class A